MKPLAQYFSGKFGVDPNKILIFHILHIFAKSCSRKTCNGQFTLTNISVVNQVVDSNQILIFLHLQKVAPYCPIYIDQNPYGFGTFWTKHLGVSGTQEPRGLGISADDCLIFSEKLFRISLVQSSGLVRPSSFLLHNGIFTLTENHVRLLGREIGILHFLAFIRERNFGKLAQRLRNPEQFFRANQAVVSWGFGQC